MCQDKVRGVLYFRRRFENVNSRNISSLFRVFLDLPILSYLHRDKKNKNTNTPSGHAECVLCVAVFCGNKWDIVKWVLSFLDWWDLHCPNPPTLFTSWQGEKWTYYPVVYTSLLMTDKALASAGIQNFKAHTVPSCTQFKYTHTHFQFYLAAAVQFNCCSTLLFLHFGKQRIDLICINNNRDCESLRSHSHIHTLSFAQTYAHIQNKRKNRAHSKASAI